MKIIELKERVWLVAWVGMKPNLTTKKKEAKQFETEERAKMGLQLARRWKPFPDAKITDMEVR